MTDYHERHAKYAAANWHRRFLRDAYRQSYQAVEELGSRPLDRPEPEVLLCGVGAPATLLEFARFIGARRTGARLTVVDIALGAVAASQAFATSPASSVAIDFACADARALPFHDAAFDLVETDFLLQFLSQRDREAVLREWRRVLRPNGAFMTRDWVVHDRRLDRLLDRMHRFVLRRVLDAQTFTLSHGELCKALADTGFAGVMKRLNHLPLIHVIAGTPRP